MTLPPDRPTERIRPEPAPVPRQPVAYEPAPVAYEPAPVPTIDVATVLVRLEDAIRSVRTGLMVVGVIAVAALGVAIYALVKDDSATSGGGGASSARVSQLDDRIDRLSRQVQGLRSANSGAEDAAAVAGRVDALEGTVKTLAARPTPGDATQAVKELSDRIDDVTADVEQLKTAQTP